MVVDVVVVVVPLVGMIHMKNCLLPKNGRSALGWGGLLFALGSGRLVGRSAVSDIEGTTFICS